MVRAKFTVVAVTNRVGGSSTVEMGTLYDESIPEDQRFQKATPFGSISMNIDNPAAADQFILGKKFYADFTEVPTT